jgi:hypothetical protein
MTTSHLKMGVEPTFKTLCVSNIPQTMDGVQHNVAKIKKYCKKPLENHSRTLTSITVRALN